MVVTNYFNNSPSLEVDIGKIKWRRWLGMFCGRVQLCFGDEDVSWRHFSVCFDCVKIEDYFALSYCTDSSVCESLCVHDHAPFL